MKRGIKETLLSLIFIPVLITAQEVLLYNELNSPLISNKLSAIAIDSSNSIWVGSDTTLFQYRSNSWIPSLTSSSLFPDIEVSPNGRVFTITHTKDYISRILFFETNHWSKIEPDLGSVFDDPLSIAIKNDTAVYFPLENNWQNQIFENSIGIYRGNDSLEIITPYTTLVNTEPYLTRIYGVNSIAPLNGDTLLITDWDGIHLFYDSEGFLNNPNVDSSSTYWDYWTRKIKKIGSHVFVLGGNFFEYKNDIYQSYSEIDSILSADSLIVTSIDVENNSIFWIGTDKGKILKYDHSLKVFEFTDSKIKDISIDKDGNKWFISDEGCFVFNENKIVGIRQEESTPNDFELSQNYPNPFNPSTVIKYSIPLNISHESQIVSLRVYDILGRVIATLVNKPQSAGKYEITFDAANLTSGIYFYQLNIAINSTSKFSQTKKMLLLK